MMATQQNANWQAMKARYLRDVETTLASVRHPKVQEVLDDVSNHLDERFAELPPDQQTDTNLRTILDAMGPAAEYAEILQGQPAKPIEQPKPKFNGWIALTYAMVFAASLLLAYAIAFNSQNASEWFTVLFLPILGPVLLIKLIVFGLFRNFRKLKLTGISFLKLFFADHVSTMLFVLAFFYVQFILKRGVRFEAFPQSIFLLDWIITLVGVCLLQLAAKFRLPMIIIVAVVLNALAVLGLIFGTSTSQNPPTPDLSHVEVGEYHPRNENPQSGRIVDRIDYPFVNDSEVIGTWKSVDFVELIEDFQPSRRLWQADLYLKQMILLPYGRTGGPWRWTKGLIIHPGDKTAAKYELRKLDKATYMFFEWKSGDYTIRHMKPWYYVLKKASVEDSYFENHQKRQEPTLSNK